MTAPLPTRRLVRQTPWLRGAGLHGGRPSAARVLPAPPGSGITFVRHDLAGRVRIAVTLDAARPTPRRTTLAGPGATQVATPEHLLSALVGLGVRDAEVLIAGGEVPVLDGSARPWARVLAAASETGPPALPAWVIARPFSRSRGASRVDLLPGDAPEVACAIDYRDPAIGRQFRRFRPGDPWTYEAEIAPARTFGLLAEARALRDAGLALGASLACAVVFGDEGILTPGGLRFADEPVRHKLLDALGDLALLGGPPAGRVRLHRASHRLLLATMRAAVAAGALVPTHHRRGNDRRHVHAAP